MPIIVRCENGCRIRVPDSKLGKSIECPRCKIPVAVSNPTSEPQEVVHINTGEVENEWVFDWEPPKSLESSNVNIDDLVRIDDDIRGFDPDQFAGRIERAKGDRILVAKFVGSF